MSQFSQVRSASSRHAYLGEDLEDLSTTEDLEVGKTYALPIIPLRGVVMFPGASLPLMDDPSVPGMSLQLRRAFAAPPPLSRLIAVVCLSGPLPIPPRLVGCTVELRQAGSSQAGCRAIGRGRQRILVDLIAGWQPPSLVLPDGYVGPLPRAIQDGMTSVHPKVARLFDVQHCARTAQQLCAKLFPQLVHGDGTKHVQPPTQPLLFSYWLASNLPLSSRHRQLLLEAPNILSRLRFLVDVLTLYEREGVLRCASCLVPIVNAGDVLQTTDEGSGSAYCNAHGHVHDLATFTQLAGRGDQVRLHGEPDPSHSWFPGYAWTIASCSLCRAHLGWRFTPATELPPSHPQCFWGIRRDALADVCLNAPSQHVLAQRRQQQQQLALGTVSEYESFEDDLNSEPSAFSTEDEQEAGAAAAGAAPAAREAESGGERAEESPGGASSEEGVG